MKKILAILLAVMAMAVSAQTQRVAYLTQAVDYTSSEIRFELTDTNRVADVYIYWAVQNESFTLKDSLQDSFTSPDTFTITGLLNGVTYDFYIIYVDTSGTDTTISVSLTHTTTTTNYKQTISDSGITHEGATILWDHVEADTGIAEVRCYVYNVSDSLWAAGVQGDTIVPRKAVDDTIYVTFFSLASSNIINAADTVIYYVSSTRDSVSDLEAGVAIDTSLADTSSSLFIYEDMEILTKYYYIAIVGSVDVFDTLDIDSLTTIAPDTIFVITGLEEGETYYYGTEALDSALTDSSAQRSFTTLDLTGAMTVALLAGTPTTITVTVTPNTATDFNGVDSINLFEGAVADSLLDVATVTLAETVTVAVWDTSVILDPDTLLFYWDTNRDSVLELFGGANTLSDTTLAPSWAAPPSFVKDGLASITKYYFSAVVGSVDVWDTVAIDSVTTTTLVSAVFSRTGKFRGGQYHYWAQMFDSIYCDSISNDSISIPLITSWGTSDLTLTWNNPSSMPSQTYPVDGIETVYYNCWMTGATFIAKDSVKLFVYDETWGLEVAIDSSAFIVTDTLTIAVDSVACNNKDLIKFKIVSRHPTTTDDIIGKLNMYIEIQDRPF